MRKTRQRRIHTPHPQHIDYQRQLVSLVRSWRRLWDEFAPYLVRNATQAAKNLGLRTDAQTPRGEISTGIEAIDVYAEGNAALVKGLCLRTDAQTPRGEISTGMAAFGARLESTAFWAKSRAKEQAERTADKNRKNTDKQIKTLVGIEGLPESEPWLFEAVDVFAQENANLVAGLSGDLVSQLSQIVTTGVMSGQSLDDMAQDIEDRFGVAENRARLIARDQTAKFNGELNQIRQGQLGIERYVWRTSMDERVREEHARLEGTVQSWEDPPEPGHPGTDFNCRCTAEPYFGDEGEAAAEE